MRTHMHARMHTRDATIWVNTVLHIAFECIAIYFRIAIFDIMSLKLVLAVKAKYKHVKQQEIILNIHGYERSSHICSVIIGYLQL